MGDDVVFVAVGCAGALLGLWRVVWRRLSLRDTIVLMAVGGSASIGALVVGGLGNIGEPGGFFDHRADLGATVLLVMVMLVPVWGLLDEAVLTRVGDLGIVSMGFAVAYRTAPDIGDRPALLIAGMSILFVPALARTTDAKNTRLKAYGWFLTGAVVLAAVELGEVVEPLTSTDSAANGVTETFVAFAALVWLAFHGFFAAKYVLILFTCHRHRGRELARAFARRVVVPASVSRPVMLATLTAEAAILYSDHRWDWASDTVVTALVVLAIPSLDRGNPAQRPDMSPAGGEGRGRLSHSP